jgi:DNA-binding NarL/FixJ family response regulator
MQRAAEQGIHVGRPPGSTEDEAKLIAKYPEVIRLIERGYSLRDIAYETGVAINTVRKVKASLS